MHYGTHTSRNCTRCGKELTDAASMEAGIGPICRQLDNALLARLIPTNLTAAKDHLAKLDLSTSDPASLDVLMNVEAAILADDAGNREDWRTEVKRIEWSLSFSGNQHLRSELTNLVAALGYVGLAALWNGDAATGEATVSCANGRLMLAGPQKAAANATFKSIPGRLWHPKGTLAPHTDERGVWSFPAAKLAEVKMAVITHYPNHKGLSEALIEAAKFLAANAPAKLNPARDVSASEVAPAPKASPCSIEHVGVLLKIRMPYDKVKTPAYVNDLKTALVWTDRRWNKVEKCWEVAAIHEGKVKELLTKHFGDGVVL